MYFFEAVFILNSCFFRRGTFLGAGISWKKSLFLIVLRNQFQSIYTWKEFLLTSIHSFKYSMVRSDFEIPQSFIVENNKQRINFNSVTNVSFWKPGSNFGIFKHPSTSSPYHLWFKRCCSENSLKTVKNWTACHFWRAEDVAIKFWKVVYLYKSFGKRIRST